jgi:hypothetical protein
VRPTLVVGNGPSLFVTGPGPRTLAGPFATDFDPRHAATRFDTLGPEDLPSGLLTTLETVPADQPLFASPGGLARALSEALHRPVGTPTVEELRRARAALPPPEPDVERRFLLALGRHRLEQALRSPEEVLVTLAREEERVERSVGREARAAESFVPVPDSPLDHHLDAWARARGALGELEDALRRTLESEAKRLVPNLSAVVGARTAARLVAAAGGVRSLARMPSARIQLLGSRRRPSPDRGPRFGVLYRADRLAEVPVGRRGAYARSLAALAAIAVRADATTHRDISAALVARRDRRVDALKRRVR